MAVIWENESFEVVEKNGFKSLVSKLNFAQGDLVCKVEGEEIEKPNRYSVQIAVNKHVNVQEPVKYINHNCLGNIILKDKYFIAKIAISPGDEISFDYNQSESELAEPFECFRCGQKVKGSLFSSQLPCLK